MDYFNITFTDSNCKLYYYLGKEADKYLRTKWNVLTDTAFQILGERFPDDLARIITQANLPDADLTYAASAMCHCVYGRLIVSTLLPLLDHPSAVVREGAILGIQHVKDGKVEEKLKLIAERDPSPAIRDTAKDALHD